MTGADRTPTLTLTEAQALVARATAKAAELGIAVSVAVVDAGGYLVAFGRMDGAGLFTAEVAQGKAYGVVFLGCTSAEVRDLATARPPFFDAVKRLGLRTAIPSPGGLPVPGGGAIGVSGAANPDQDVEIAEAALRG